MSEVSRLSIDPQHRQGQGGRDGLRQYAGRHVGQLRDGQAGGHIADDRHVREPEHAHQGAGHQGGQGRRQDSAESPGPQDAHGQRHEGDRKCARVEIGYAVRPSP